MNDTLKEKERALTAEKLREILEYDPDTGKFTWKVSVGGRSSMGKVAGRYHSTGRYREIRIFERTYRAHRLAFLWMTGAWPEKQVDHIDGNGLNNSWSNLRDVSPSQNNYNAKLNYKNTTGCPGVRKNRSRWEVRIRVENKRYYLGTYRDLDEAIRVAIAFREKYHGEYSSNSRLGLVPSDPAPSLF